MNQLDGLIMGSRTGGLVRTAWLAALVVLSCLSYANVVLADDVRRIAFSFDDAPTKSGPLLSGDERTKMLVNALRASGINGAAFFVLTEQVTNKPEREERLRTYTQAGHVLANHTHTHPWLRNTDPAAYLAEVDKAAEVLSAFDNVRPYFRYPYLDEGDTKEKRLKVARGLQVRGLRNGYVTIDTYDWYLQALVTQAVEAQHPLDMDQLKQVYVDVLVETIEFYDALSIRTLGRHAPHVLLLHENDLAALFVDDLAQALKRNGWQFISVDEAYYDEIANVQPDTQFNGQGRVAAIAHSRGVHPRHLVSPMEEERFLRSEFVRNGLLPKNRK